MNRMNAMLLMVIVALLAVLAGRDLVQPAPVAAQASRLHLYFEPGTTTLRAPDGKRQVTGKVVVNLDTGEVWGFPTLVSQPYPVDATSSEPPVSSPMYLGKFDLARMAREP